MKNRQFLPSISVLMPTLNAASVLEGCLKSITNQDYPREKVEIIIADGGSKDKTVEIAKKYNAKVYKNFLRTAESGKAVALKKAKGEFVVLIDSDNILPNKNWIKRMVKPFSSKEVIGSEPWEYTYRANDGFIDRYCALMGMNDPYCYFLGNYDRLNVLTGKWTSLKIKTVDCGDWIKVSFDNSGRIPTIGANGTFLRRSFLLERNQNKDYFFDVDVLTEASRCRTILFAKVKTGMIHLYCGSDIKKFIRKQKRRVSDYLYHEKSGARVYPWRKQNKTGIFKFIFCCFTILPLFFQSLKGYLKKKDSAWFFHPLACWITLVIYTEGRIASYFSVKEMDREGWKQ